MRSASTPVSAAAQATSCFATCAASASKPAVWRATKGASYSRSATMTCIMPRARAASVPGRSRSVSFECAAASVLRTSMVTTYAPRRFAAARWGAVFGWLARLAPQRRTSAAFAPMSSLVLVRSTPVSPRPKAPRPQQIIVGLHHWQPYRLAKRRSSWEERRVP